MQGNGQGANALPFDGCLCFLDVLSLCPIHQEYRGAQWSPPAPNTSHPALSVQTNGVLHSSQSQPQFFSPTSTMTSPSPSSALSPFTAPGYGGQTTTMNYDGNLPYAEGESYAPQSPSWPSAPPSALKSRIFCDVPGCDKSFTAAHNLRYHQRTHAGIKPYICDNCGNAYRSQSDLTRHQKKAKVPCTSPASPSRS